MALDFQLMTKHTSLIAVDVTPARSSGEELAQHAMPVNLPHGWTLKDLFDNVQTHTPQQLLQRHSTAKANRTDGQKLLRAQGATMAELHMMLGVAALMVSLGLMVWVRRRDAAAQ